MIALLIRALAGIGLSQQWAKRAAPAVLALALAAIVLAGAALLLRRHDAAVIGAHEQRLDARAAPAREAAADQRAIDAATIRNEERAYHDAIQDSGDDGPPDPAAVALGCQRLRRAGLALPPACGSAGGH